MASYIVVDAAGLIYNRVALDPGAEWQPDEGFSIFPDSAEVYSVGGTYINGAYTPPVGDGVLVITNPPSVLSQELMAQFTADDAGLIRTAVNSNSQFWLLWSALQAQKDPMLVTNARFLTGWAALIQVLGQERMTQIATALKVTI
jgi:hypothetical protein